MEYYYCKKLFALCLKAKKHNEVPIAAKNSLCVIHNVSRETSKMDL